MWDHTADRVTVRIGRVSGVFTRGLLSELVAPLADWYEFAPLAFAVNPLERGTITDVPGLSFVLESVAGGWRLTGRVRTPRRRVPMGGHVMPSAVGPLPMLTDDAAGEWAADQFFADRFSLVVGVACESASLVDDLKDAVGDRWPRPRT